MEVIEINSHQWYNLHIDVGRNIWPTVKTSGRRCWIMKSESKAVKGRKCYDHLGGKLGSRLFEKLVELEWIKLEEGKATVYEVTNKGCEELGKLGIKLED